MHRGLAESWTVRHNCALAATGRDAFRMIPRHGVSGSIPAGDTTFCLHTGITVSADRPDPFRIRETAEVLLTRLGIIMAALERTAGHTRWALS